MMIPSSIIYLALYFIAIVCCSTFISYYFVTCILEDVSRKNKYKVILIGFIVGIILAIVFCFIFIPYLYKNIL